jgi:RNA polymerase subunit RPABC4/transcription elongation factor Spt4
MSSTTTERTTSEPATWVCENCQGVTATVRKRCRDCGTSRF